MTLICSIDGEKPPEVENILQVCVCEVEWLQ